MKFLTPSLFFRRYNNCWKTLLVRTTTVSVAGAMDHAERTLVLDRDSPQISVRNGPISLGQLTPSPGYICDVVLSYSSRTSVLQLLCRYFCISILVWIEHSLDYLDDI